MPTNYENSYYIIFCVPLFTSSHLGSDIPFRIFSSNTLSPATRSFDFRNHLQQQLKSYIRLSSGKWHRAA